MLKDGDRVLILFEDNSEHVMTVTGQGFLSTRFGTLFFDEIIGKEYGETSKVGGKTFYILEPGIVDHIFSLKRGTQIVYPKDMGYILLKLDVKEGDLVVECGSGSGSMTCAFARAVGSGGRVISYERRPETSRIAFNNMKAFGLADRVQFKVKDIEDGVDEEGADAFFLDVPEPSRYLETVLSALKGSGRLCVLCPTANQVEEVLEKLQALGTVRLEVTEIFIRDMKINPERFRPEDKMVGHTAYLVFGTRVLEGGEKWVNSLRQSRA